MEDLEIGTGGCSCGGEWWRVRDQRDVTLYSCWSCLTPPTPCRTLPHAPLLTVASRSSFSRYLKFPDKQHQEVDIG